MNSVNFMDAMNSGKRFRPLGYGKNNPEIWFEMRQDSDFLGEKVLYHVDDNAGGAPEGTAVLSTGEGGGTKFLREDGDNTCSWQVPGGGGDLLAANNLSDVFII